VSQYAIVIEGDGSTNYSTYAPDLPGVVATGDTLEECEAEMRAAIEFHIKGLRHAGESVPPATSHVASLPCRASNSAAAYPGAGRGMVRQTLLLATAAGAYGRGSWLPCRRRRLRKRSR
jgi:predicted RNase H-like HicB family nuclease